MTANMKTFIGRPLFGVVFFLTLLIGCKKKENPSIGFEAQPENDRLGLLTTDTFLINCTTLRLDSVRSSGAKIGVIGSYQDPTFGLVKTGSVFQYRLASESIDIEKLKTYQIDSAVLTLVYSGYYGSLENQTFDVHEVQQTLSASNTYHTNYKVSFDKNKTVGRLIDFKPDFSSIPVIDGEPERAEIRIMLDSSFARKLVDAPSTAYNNNDNFLNTFYGFYVRANNINQANETGAQIAFDLLNEFTRLTLYYTEPNGTRSKLDYPINDKSVRFLISEHDYSGSEVDLAFNDAGKGNENIYLQSGGGTMVKIETPDISKLVSKGKVIINKAEFHLPLDPDKVSKYPVIPQVIIFGLDESGQLFNTPDKGEVHYNGQLDKTDASSIKYRVGLTRYFQQVINGTISNNGLILMEVGEHFGRSVLQGPKSEKNPLKLVVTYTPTY